MTPHETHPKTLKVTTKAGIRREMIVRRRGIRPEEHKAMSASACDALWARADVQAAVAAKRPFAVYLANDNEPDLADLIGRLWNEGVTVAVPYWNANDACYRLAVHSNASTLMRGRHDIMEPAEIHDIAPEDVGVWIVPGLAFTRDGCRLGYGGGWYDRYLSAASPDAVALAVAYPFQMVDALPCEPHDRRVNDVILAE